MGKHYKEEVQRLTDEINSLLNSGLNPKHIVLHDFDLFLTGYHMPNASMNISWHNSIINTLTNPQSKKYGKNLHRLAISSWLEFGVARYEISKHIFIEESKKLLSDLQKNSLEKTMVAMVASISIDTYEEIRVDIQYLIDTAFKEKTQVQNA